ncbi:TetR/AcrR family transcriptional regulator [Inquilinus limosus]|uniref:TetR family transcriptional regulator n=1 Tax=Inquilinus limosus TaxID=171674 RepID=A0A211YSG4_9PROT|nr:TetR/AcrR family transcriptional regulator [Inquilinus limosus]OWJ56005.1 TetR family transcriptional regulator [Inquilinus limosus]
MPRIVAERADVLPALAEVFREHGFEGASLALIGERTGLGKGSLYHFFPGGKEEMAAAVLAEIDAWFEQHIFRPLREEEPRRAVAEMIRAVDGYFRSGRRVCLVGAFALGDVRDRFGAAIQGYFAAWTDALAQGLARSGQAEDTARDRAEEAVAAIQGALVLARALDEPAAFRRSMARIEARLTAG